MLKKTLLAYTIGFAFSPPANAVILPSNSGHAAK